MKNNNENVHDLVLSTRVLNSFKERIQASNSSEELDEIFKQYKDSSNQLISGHDDAIYKEFLEHSKISVGTLEDLYREHQNKPVTLSGVNIKLMLALINKSQDKNILNDIYNEVNSEGINTAENIQLTEREVHAGLRLTSKEDLFKEFIKNAQDTDIINKIFKQKISITGLIDVPKKARLFVELMKNDKILEDNKKYILQGLLFEAYNQKHSDISAFKESLKDLPKTADLDKAFNAMKHVSGGKELTDENKDTLKNTETWIGIIEKICHYIAKVFTLGQAATQKEARDNFNSVTDNTFTAKITAEKNNNSGQGMNM